MGKQQVLYSPEVREGAVRLVLRSSEAFTFHTAVCSTIRS